MKSKNRDVFYCTTLLLPKDTHKRAQRRHYPFLFNNSIVDFSPPLPPPRQTLLSITYRDQKRHFCGSIANSILDKYF
ncbi:hypothetical protein RN001_015363 [Aquatica leii]|uniref:Uncharacterized protein n=1 Tax=Aquatica leii TaxID=1421715 RepID=A0AAN7PPK1_9COLE|nr:hypothetical protein RN001_015363 [Aquatica leii]